MKRERDPFLDRLRTLATIWVLMIHVIYLLNFFPTGIYETLRSWLLLEMPLFFFITGAGQSLSKPRPWGQFVLRGYKRILIPYWFYALLCLLISGQYTGNWTIENLLRWLIPVGRLPTTLPLLTGALWYVPVYLLCVLVIPLLQRAADRPLPVVALLVTLLLFFERNGWYYPQNVAFYSLWIYAGIHYPAWKARYVDGKNRRWELALLAMFGVALTVVLCVFTDATADMQVNKFPPNGVFLTFSVGSMSLLALVIPWLVSVMDRLGRIAALDRVMKILGQYSLSVFLYQSLAFIMLARMIEWATQMKISVSVQFVCCCVLIVPMAVILAALFGPLERLGKRRKA